MFGTHCITINVIWPYSYGLEQLNKEMIVIYSISKPQNLFVYNDLCID